MHTKKTCTQEKICLNCSQVHDMVEGVPCPNAPYCKSCHGPHSCVSKDCPVYAEEEKIIKLRIDQGITFGEARKQIKEQKAQTQTYASCVQNRMSAEESAKDDIIQALRTELQTVRAEFNQLKELYKKSLHQQQDHQQQCLLRKEAHQQQKQTTPEFKEPPASSQPKVKNANSSATSHISRKDQPSKSPPKEKRNKNAQANKINDQPATNIWTNRIRSRSNKRACHASPTESDPGLRGAKTFVAQAPSIDESQMQL